MGRSTQFIGLSKEARDFLNENVEKIGSSPCPHCGKNTTEVMNELDSNEFAVGMFNEEIPLNRWKLKNGCVVQETVQTEIWSSGPMIYTCLQNEQTKELFCKWPDSEFDF